MSATRPYIPLSFSVMGDAACPFRFKVLRVDKSFKEPESEAMKTGGDVARLLAAYRLHCYKAGLAQDLGFFEEHFGQEMSESVKSFVNTFKRSEFATIPLEGQWVQIEGRFAYDRELRFLPGKSWMHPNVGFRAAVDFAYRLGDTLYIVDDKTGYGDPDHYQLEIYACLVGRAFFDTEKARAIGVNRIVCMFNELGKRAVETLEFSTADASRVAPNIEKEMQRINSWTEYPAIACAKCKFCQVPGCAVREQTEMALVTADRSPVIAVPREIISKEMAEKALEFVVFADALVDEIKGKLKAYVAANGPVYSGGMAASISETESWNIADLRRVVNALAGYGIPPEIIWQNLSLTKAAIEKILKRAKAQDKQPLLMYMIEAKKGERFSIGKDKMAA